MSMNALAAEIHEQAVKNGFWPDGDRNIGEALMLIVSEIAEAQVEHRNGMPLRYYDHSTGKPEGLAVELADSIIRCLDLMAGLGVDIDEVITEKMKYNETRPFKHGKAY